MTTHLLPLLRLLRMVLPHLPHQLPALHHQQCLASSPASSHCLAVEECHIPQNLLILCYIHCANTYSRCSSVTLLKQRQSSDQQRLTCLTKSGHMAADWIQVLSPSSIWRQNLSSIKAGPCHGRLGHLCFALALSLLPGDEVQLWLQVYWRPLILQLLFQHLLKKHASNDKREGLPLQLDEIASASFLHWNNYTEQIM